MASAPLVSNEQMSLGGLDTVRGYVETQELVDDGIAGSVEFRSADFATRVGVDAVTELRWSLFLDAAAGRIRSPLPGQAESAALAALGLGLHLRGYQGVETALAWALPVLSADDIEAGDSRLHFHLGYEF